MRLILENIGMLKSADINLKKLSVIAGENDNGKSTVGKVVFCIIKAISRYKEDLQESKEFKINESLDKIFFDLRRGSISFDHEPSEFVKKLHAIHNSELLLYEKLTVVQELIDVLDKHPEANKDILKSLNTHLSTIENLIGEPENVKRSIENALNKVFASEFDSNILKNGEKDGFIQLFDNEIKLIDIKILSGHKVKLLSDVEKIELKDATFIESPLILNNHDLLIRSQSGLGIRRSGLSRLGIPYTTLHTKDLFDKLIELPVDDLLDIFEEDKKHLDFKQNIKNIINGNIEYDRNLRDFTFKSEGNDVSIKNTASGIKVFGILQLLSNNGFINTNSILIFDEPENHLHPKWQLKLAKILVNLAKSGVHILISSHSPYMIEALKRYSDNVALKEEAGFYLAENKKIENRNRLEEIFNKLAEPFEIFRKMDAEILRDE